MAFRLLLNGQRKVEIMMRGLRRIDLMLEKIEKKNDVSTVKKWGIMQGIVDPGAETEIETLDLDPRSPRRRYRYDSRSNSRDRRDSRRRSPVRYRRDSRDRRDRRDHSRSRSPVNKRQRDERNYHSSPANRRSNDRSK